MQGSIVDLKRRNVGGIGPERGVSILSMGLVQPLAELSAMPTSERCLLYMKESTMKG